MLNGCGLYFEECANALRGIWRKKFSRQRSVLFAIQNNQLALKGTLRSCSEMDTAYKSEARNYLDAVTDA